MPSNVATYARLLCKRSLGLSFACSYFGLTAHFVGGMSLKTLLALACLAAASSDETKVISVMIESCSG